MRNVMRAILTAAVATLLVASASLPSDAVARARYSPTRAFDGVWSVSIMTYYGDCDRSYRYPLRVWYGRVLKVDNDPNYNVAGAVARSGAIGVTVSGGGKTASGTGRLTRTTGAGIWHTSNGECSGRWTAERRG
jgi:hypothetical protein